MAPEPKPKTGKKILGLSPYVWGGIVIGGGGIVYYLKKRSDAAAAAAATGTTDANTTPANDTSSETTTAPSTLAQWVDDALGTSTTATYTNSDLLNDINSWLGGNCVSSQGYTSIGNLVSTLGVPPGYSTTPTLSVCASSTATGTGTTGSSSTSTTPNVDPVVAAAISAANQLQSAVISNVSQGQNPTQAYNNAQSKLPALTTAQAAEYVQQTGTPYAGNISGVGPAYIDPATGKLVTPTPQQNAAGQAVAA